MKTESEITILIILRNFKNVALNFSIIRQIYTSLGFKIGKKSFMVCLFHCTDGQRNCTIMVYLKLFLFFKDRFFFLKPPAVFEISHCCYVKIYTPIHPLNVTGFVWYNHDGGSIDSFSCIWIYECIVNINLYRMNI